MFLVSVLVAHAEGLGQAERIGCRLAFLQSASGAHGIDDLVDVEKGDAESKDEVQTAGVIGTKDEQSKDEQVGQSFGVLRAVNGTDAKGKKSGQNAGDCGIRAVRRSQRRHLHAGP